MRYRNPHMAALLGLLGAAWMGVAAASAVSADLVQVRLKNGSSVEAELLARTESHLVLDLGFNILSIPLDRVESEQGPEAPAADNDGPDTVVQSEPGARKPSAKRFESFDQMVEQLEEGVVIVSNPGGLGAGFIIDSSGLLFTNYHVIRGEKYHDITLLRKSRDGKPEKRIIRRCEVLAFSSLLDCALVQIPEKELKDIDLTVLALAEPDSLRTSMRVFAIGNPAVGSKVLDHTVSQGILSSTSRNFNDILYLQTTAAINPGNSGGPLLNTRGEVVGLVTFRATFQEGLAFALPIWYLRHFLNNTKAYVPAHDSKNTGYRYHSPMGGDSAEVDAGP